MMRGLKGLWRSVHIKKLFAYFVALFLIPFALIAATILSNLFSSFSQQATREQLSRTEQAIDQLQSYIASFDQITGQLVGDSEIHPEKLDLYSEQSQLRNRLNLINATSTNLINIWYELPDGDLLAGNDALSVERLNAARFSLPDSSEDMIPIKNRLLAGEILSAYDRYISRACILYPVFIRSSYGRQTMIVFELNMQTIESELESLLSESPGRVRLRTSEGSVLALLERECDQEFPPPLACTDSLAAPYAVSASSQGSMLRGEHVIFTSVAASRWAIDLICSSNLVGRFQVMQLVALLLMAVFLFGCCVCMVLTVRLYKPIRSIRDSISSSADISSENVADDYDYIESSIELISLDNRQLRRMLSEHARDTRNFVASMLFSGRVRSLGEFQHTYAFCGEIPEGEWYCIVAADTSRVSIDKLLTHPAFNGRVRFYLASRSACTLFFESADAPAPADDLPRLGVASPSDDWTRIPIKCAQAWFALALGKGVFEESLCDEAASARSECEAAFDAALSERNLSPLRALLDALPDGELAINAVSLAACLLRGLEELPELMLDDASIFYVRPNAAPGEARNALAAFLSLMELLLMPEENEAGDTLERMNQYIAKFYDTPNFSIKQMASDFSMSISALSGYFKSRTGVLLSDYITEMKMKKAMQLLEYTNLSVQEVGLAIGYFHVNSFIRRFRQMNQLSPREYRALKQKR